MYIMEDFVDKFGIDVWGWQRFMGEVNQLSGCNDAWCYGLPFHPFFNIRSRNTCSEGFYTFLMCMTVKNVDNYSNKWYLGFLSPFFLSVFVF